MKAPFPYFGGKSRVAPIVWQALGDPKRYIEPFFGSGAVLLNRPTSKHSTQLEIINDADGHIANLWRALQAEPDAVAKVCDWPCNHADLSARKKFLNRNGADLLSNLLADPEFYDVKMAGYWIWVASHWIGSGLTGEGAIPFLAHNRGVGKIPHLTNNKSVGQTFGDTAHPDRHVQEPYNDHLWVWFRQLSERLRHVKVVCGDWSRVCGGNWQTVAGICGIFFDPPYSDCGRDKELYAVESLTVTHDVRDWCILRGNDPAMRIVLAGYFDEHESLLGHGWTAHNWSATGGYSRKHTRGADNRHREALFMSPHCLPLETNAAMQTLELF
jgi:DNA adenine methylase